jgi:hypothetical protein
VAKRQLFSKNFFETKKMDSQRKRLLLKTKTVAIVAKLIWAQSPALGKPFLLKWKMKFACGIMLICLFKNKNYFNPI